MEVFRKNKELDEFINKVISKLKEIATMMKSHLRVIYERLALTAAKCRKLKTDENKKEVNAILKHLRLLRELCKSSESSNVENQQQTQSIGIEKQSVSTRTKSTKKTENVKTDSADDKEFVQYEKKLRNLNKNITKEEILEKYKKYKEKKSKTSIVKKTDDKNSIKAATKKEKTKSTKKIKQ